MKLIESKVELIGQQPGLEGMYKQIELAGRTCYKSEDKITEDSAKEFVDRMIKLGHGAMLEHGTVYLKLPAQGLLIQMSKHNHIDYENNKYKHETNQYTGIFEGKNVIAIHAESIQGFTMNLAFNNEELTPNINKLAKEGIYFSNFYAQESVGNSSDSEFTSLSSLLPSSSGTVFMNYFNRDYETILKLLKEEKDYYTFSMHGNKGDAWNRNVTYSYLGYDDFYYYTKDYEIDETIGLGLSDKSFFRQSVEIIKDIDSKNENWYGTLVMLTNHTPWDGTDEYSELDLSMKVDINGEDITRSYLEDIALGRYIKSINYMDKCIGKFLDDMDSEGLLDNTVIVFV